MMQALCLRLMLPLVLLEDSSSRMESLMSWRTPLLRRQLESTISHLLRYSYKALSCMAYMYIDTVPFPNIELKKNQSGAWGWSKKEYKTPWCYVQMVASQHVADTRQMLYDIVLLAYALKTECVATSLWIILEDTPLSVVVLTSLSTAHLLPQITVYKQNMKSA